MNILRLVIAFKAEAAPFIEHYALKPEQTNDEFPIYQNGACALVLSGPGTAAAAAATHYLHKVSDQSPNALWINTGIAGHPHLRLGSVALAGDIIDRAGGRSWQTAQNVPHQLAVEKLITVDSPETEYKEQALYDMEAAGFYPAALLYSRPERVQCLKVVSDNNDSPLCNFSIQRAAGLMREAAPVLISTINALLQNKTP